MAKRSAKPGATGLIEDTKEKILATLGVGDRHEQIVLFIPSHDKKNKPISDQHMWAEGAAELFAQLYGGATAFQALHGTFKTDKGDILRDQPILVESYTERVAIEDQESLGQLLEFAIRMGRETKQDTVGVVVSDFIHFIPV